MNRYSIIIFIILLLPVFIPKANSQNYTNFQFKKIGVDTGLSESSVYCCKTQKDLCGSEQKTDLIGMTAANSVHSDIVKTIHIL